MMTKIRDLKIFVYLLIYKLLLDLGYIIFVNRYFEYMNFPLEFKSEKYIFSILVFILMYYILPKTFDKPSFAFLQLHFIIIFIPMFTIYAFMNQSTNFFVLCMIMFLLQCILIRILPNFNIVRIKGSKVILYSLLFIITIFVYTSMIRANGLPSLKALNILNVYYVRETVIYPFLMEYLAVWQSRVINPFLITISYLNKNWKLFGIAIALQLLLYLITAHKTFLFIPIAIIFIIFIMKKFDFFKILSQVSTLGVSFTLIIYVITQNILLPSLFIRRFLMVPAQIRFFYYDFFSENEFLRFSAGAIGNILGIEYPYETNIVNMIGDIYFNNINTAANTGYIADAYANLGISGMIIISVLLVLIFKLLDSLSTSIGKELVIGITLFSVLSLNDGALLTALLTGGLLFLLLTLYLYSNSRQLPPKL